MRSLALVVAALIVSFLSFGNELSLTTYFSTLNSFRLRRREYLTGQAQSQSSGIAFEKKTPVRTHICKRPILHRFLVSLRFKVTLPLPPTPPLIHEIFGAWHSIDPPPLPPPIISAAA